MSQTEAAVQEALREADAREAGRGEGAARSLSSDKAQRIIDAMRSSVARRGSAGSTFDHVSREAGVSRGLLHYYFGTKEQLLVEAVRRDCELRIERLQGELSLAQTAEDFIELMVQGLQAAVREDPDFVTLVFELFTLGRRNEDIGVEYAALIRRSREQFAAMLAAADEEGVLRLNADAEAIADILFSMADGFALRLLSEPDRDFSASIAAGMAAVRTLIAD
jgi:AcrR family transcriptional regulator